jgi:hypothetical protein
VGIVDIRNLATMTFDLLFSKKKTQTISHDKFFFVFVDNRNLVGRRPWSYRWGYAASESLHSYTWMERGFYTESS